jgi:hypothetical protein
MVEYHETWITIEGQEIPLRLCVSYIEAGPEMRDDVGRLAAPPETSGYIIESAEWPDNLDEQTGWERVPTQVFDVIMKQEFEMLDRAELEAVNV